jgi:hypothetical protein
MDKKEADADSRWTDGGILFRGELSWLVNQVKLDSPPWVLDNISGALESESKLLQKTTLIGV